MQDPVYCHAILIIILQVIHPFHIADDVADIAGAVYVLLQQDRF